MFLEDIMCMEKTPSIRVIFNLVKKDRKDFDRDAISQSLGLKPSLSSGPKLGKGALRSIPDDCTAGVSLCGVSFIPSDDPPFQMVKHALWRIELPETESWSIDEPIHKMEEILRGKEEQILLLCREYNLFSNLRIQIHADPDTLPVLSIPGDSVKFWGELSTFIDLDLCAY